MTPVPIGRTALLIVDLQNDFLHPDGAYGRAGQGAPEIAALPMRLKPLADAVRAKGGWIVSTQFTLVPAKGGEPLISPHLKALRPFLGRGDFAPGSWGHAWWTSSSRPTCRWRRSPIPPST
jgi:nicotinamidase-related amidase